MPNKEIPYINDGDAYRANQWLEAHGYYDPSSVNEYSSYTRETLTELASQGDIKAIQLLAIMMLKEGDRNAAFNEFIRAATYGSTYALTAAAEFYERDFINASTEKEKEYYALNSLALLEAAVMRGDKLIEHTRIKFFKELNGFYPSQAQDKIIHELAGKIYEELKQKRIS